MASLILIIISYIVLYIKSRKTLKISEIPNSKYNSHIIVYTFLIKTFQKLRQTLKINKIHHFNHDNTKIWILIRRSLGRSEISGALITICIDPD